MRQIVLDTETTGIGHAVGHKIIEIGCVEMIDRRLTGKHFHVYLNPKRKVDDGAFRVHGISNEFLQDKPLFADIVSEFVQFIENSELIIHNAPFDVGFINAELSYVNWLQKLEDHCKIVDTLVYAREKHPGQRNNLDALCKRYEIDNSSRDLHGALLDAEILAHVYLAMTGGQANLFTEEIVQSKLQDQIIIPQALAIPLPVIKASEEELLNHKDFIKFLLEQGNNNYWEKESQGE